MYLSYYFVSLLLIFQVDLCHPSENQKMGRNKNLSVIMLVRCFL